MQSETISDQYFNTQQKLGHSSAVSLLPHICVFSKVKQKTEPQHLTLYFKDDRLCKLYFSKICNPISIFLNSEFSIAKSAEFAANQKSGLTVPA